ncbi:MAG: 50S ribosomal protein L17 [Bacteroidetes bacterium]|nr:50S ribosomal protein L17 [Bacteroidota bacterium]
MRHGKKFNHLGRTSSHRKALLSNMATSLILHKRITTTLAKAKELRKYVEPLITKSKENTTHNRRVVFSYLGNKDAVNTLFGEVAEKVANRPGGYTRILKLVNRYGDNAEMAIIELVDYNEMMLAAQAEKKAGATKTRRSRRGAGTVKAKTETKETAPVAEAEVVEEVKVETPVAETEVIEEVKAEVDETPAAESTEETSEEEKKD